MIGLQHWFGKRSIKFHVYPRRDGTVVMRRLVKTNRSKKAPDWAANWIWQITRLG